MSFPFTLIMDAGTGSQELVSVTSGAGTSGTPYVITRGYDGTTAASHAQGAAVSHDFSASDVYTSRLHEAMGSGSGVHGLPSSAWATAAFAVINETTLSNSTTSVQTWSSIPSTYSHLLIVALGRLTEATDLNNWVSMQLNGDSAARYSYMSMYANNNGGSLSAPSAFTTFAGTNIPIIRMQASQAGAGVNAGAGFCLLPWYTSTVFNKVSLSQSGGGNGTSSNVDGEFSWGFYNPTSQAAINSISLSTPSGFFLTGTSFGLYGIS